MMRKIGIVGTLFSAACFPWPMTVLLAVGMSAVEPLVPFAAGLFLDVLYYSAGSHFFPLFTLGGAG